MGHIEQFFKWKKRTERKKWYKWIVNNISLFRQKSKLIDTQNVYDKSLLNFAVKKKIHKMPGFLFGLDFGT